MRMRSHHLVKYAFVCLFVVVWCELSHYNGHGHPLRLYSCVCVWLRWLDNDIRLVTLFISINDFYYLPLIRSLSLFHSIHILSSNRLPPKCVKEKKIMKRNLFAFLVLSVSSSLSLSPSLSFVRSPNVWARCPCPYSITCLRVLRYQNETCTKYDQ